MTRQKHRKAINSPTGPRRDKYANKKPKSVVSRPQCHTRKSPFQYQPLDKAQKSFRLLRLYPGREDDPIRCNIFNAAISEYTGKYTAGSYVWGSKKNRKRIFVGEHHVLVTRNLFNFLHACRLHHQIQPLTLWIDALCIDQKSIIERNHQVSIMHAIYTNASCTYSWLGPAQGDSAWLFDTLSSESVRELIREKEQERRTPQGASLNGDQWALIQHGMEAMLNLASREYWKRIWIIQEVSLSPEVTLLCGNRSLSWGDIPFNINRIWGKKVPHADIQKLHSSLERTIISELAGVKAGLFQSWWRSFEIAYHSFGGLNCSVRHDSIFALLGLVAVDHEDARSFPVDYTMVDAELIIETMQHFQCSVPMEFFIKAITRLRMSPSQFALWPRDDRVINMQIERKTWQTKDFQKLRLRDRPSESLALRVYECSSGSDKERESFCRFSICCYLAPNVPGDTTDELMQLGAGQFFIIRHQECTPPSIVGMALERLGRTTEGWQLDLIRTYLDYMERLIQSSTASVEEGLKPRPTGRDQLVLKVNAWCFLTFAWMVGAIFGDSRLDEATSPYWKRNSRAMLKLLGCNPSQTTVEAELAAML